jgi:hypothetical protein
VTEHLLSDDWIPAACTLPTVAQPLRRDEFDDLFARDLVSVTRKSSQQVRLELRADPAVAARAAGLAVKETGCCSFFSFELAIAHGQVSLTVQSGAAHEQVLAALTARAEARLESGQ